MTDQDRFDSIDEAPSTLDVDDAVFGYSASTPLSEIAEKNALLTVTRKFAGNGTRPPAIRARKATALPPVRVDTSSVERNFEASAECFAELVAGHEQAF